jgi:hypothetical protein
VNGYPSLFYVRDGIVYKYSGGRNVNRCVGNQANQSTSGLKSFMVPLCASFVEFDQSGYKKAESIGPIPDETFFSSLVDSSVVHVPLGFVLAWSVRS